MSAKNKDAQGRWRSKTVAFRVSPEEDALIEAKVRMSGLTKQDYITRRLTDQSVVVQGNPRVFRGLQTEMRRIAEELKNMEAGAGMDPDLMDRIGFLVSILDGMRTESDWRETDPHGRAGRKEKANG